MRYDVYHVKQPTFGMGLKPVFPDFYDKVATVECKDPEDVFRATNHIDSDWTKNPEVIEIFKEGGVRSTSVGDVIVDADGKELYCDMIGWKEALKI